MCDNPMTRCLEIMIWNHSVKLVYIFIEFFFRQYFRVKWSNIYIRDNLIVILLLDHFHIIVITWYHFFELSDIVWCLTCGIELVWRFNAVPEDDEVIVVGVENVPRSVIRAHLQQPLLNLWPHFCIVIRCLFMLSNLISCHCLLLFFSKVSHIVFELCYEKLVIRVIYFVLCLKSCLTCIVWIIESEIRIIIVKDALLFSFYFSNFIISTIIIIKLTI